MCVPALQCLVEMQTAAALQPSSRRPLATHVLVSSMRILLFRNTCQELQVHVSREDITTRCFRCRWVRTQ